MNAGEPLNEIEAEQMMKEADKDGDGTIDYEGIHSQTLNTLKSSNLLATTLECPYFGVVNV